MDSIRYHVNRLDYRKRDPLVVLRELEGTIGYAKKSEKGDTLFYRKIVLRDDYFLRSKSRRKCIDNNILFNGRPFSPSFLRECDGQIQSIMVLDILSFFLIRFLLNFHWNCSMELIVPKQENGSMYLHKMFM